MNTKIITWNEERGFEADELAEAAQIIRDGGLKTNKLAFVVEAE